MQAYKIFHEDCKTDFSFCPTPLALLHVNAGFLLERFLADGDPCIAVGLSRQYRLMAESPQMLDDRLRVMYRTIAARWHQIGSQSVCIEDAKLNFIEEDC
jgi:hypothetical protein